MYFSQGPDAAGPRDSGLEELVHSGPAGYALLARLSLAGELAKAGKRDEAVQAYDAIAADRAAPQAFREAATIRAAYLLADTASSADLSARLAALDKPEFGVAPADQGNLCARRLARGALSGRLPTRQRDRCRSRCAAGHAAAGADHGGGAAAAAQGQAVRNAMNRGSLIVIALVVALAGCSGAADKLLEPITGKKDEILPGTRESVLQNTSPLDKGKTKEAATDPIAIPAAVSNANWAQPGGVPSNAMHNLDLGLQLKKVFAVSAGAGSSGRDRLLSGPIVVGGRIYVLDAEANVRAFNAANGSRVWGRPLAPKGRDPEGAFGGGLASDGNNIYVATAFGEVVALDAASGNEVWRKKLNSPVRAAPTVADGKVFVVTVANEVAALNTADGKQAWKHQERANRPR